MNPYQKLAALIREGAQLRMQGYGNYWSPFSNTTCALGAAYEAMTRTDWSDGAPDSLTSDVFSHCGLEIDSLEPGSVMHMLSRDLIPDGVVENWDLTEIEGVQSFPLSSIIYVLNDTLTWTREQIADWLETLPWAEEGD